MRGREHQFKSFAECTWDEIALISELGLASYVFKLHDTKDIEIEGVGTMTLEIADFNHDYLSGSTSASKAGISMITRDLLPNKKQMNSTNTNVGGFPASDLCEYLNGDIYNALPEDLKSIIVPIYKWYGKGNSTTNGAWSAHKIWVPLEYELFGQTTNAPATEHTTGNARKYPIFTDANSRIKKLNNGSGDAMWYWEASPYASDATGFRGVKSSGGATGYGASYTGGVCFGICI